MGINNAARAEVKRNLEMVPGLLKEQRARLDLALRPAAEQIGVAHSTLQRAERGLLPDGANLLLLLAWLDAPPAWFTRTGGAGEAPIRIYRRGWHDAAAAMRAATERHSDA